MQGLRARVEWIAATGPGELAIETWREGDGCGPGGAAEVIGSVDRAARVGHGCIELMQLAEVRDDEDFGESGCGGADTGH